VLLLVIELLPSRPTLFLIMVDRLGWRLLLSPSLRVHKYIYPGSQSLVNMVTGRSLTTGILILHGVTDSQCLGFVILGGGFLQILFDFVGLCQKWATMRWQKRRGSRLVPSCVLHYVSYRLPMDFLCSSCGPPMHFLWPSCVLPVYSCGTPVCCGPTVCSCRPTATSLYQWDTLESPSQTIGYLYF
jgi:hypothetical protein